MERKKIAFKALYRLPLHQLLSSVCNFCVQLVTNNKLIHLGKALLVFV